MITSCYWQQQQMPWVCSFGNEPNVISIMRILRQSFVLNIRQIFIVWYAWSGTVSCNVTLLMARVSGVSLYSTCTFRSWNLGGSSGVQFYAVALQSFCTSYVLKLAQIGCRYPSALCCSLRLNNSISRPNGFSENLRFPKRILVAFVFFRIT